MPVYEYTALNSKGKSASGILDAESSVAAKQKLRASGIFPISIQESRKETADKSGRSSPLTMRFLRVKSSEVAMMTRQLATLTGAGFPLVQALDTLTSQVRTGNLKKIVTELKSAILEGSSFSNALAGYPSVFSPLYVNMVHAGETSGTLELVLDRIADITEKQQHLKSRIRTAMAYPVLMAFIGTAVLIVLLTFIVPSITRIFEDMHQALPAPTLFLIGVSRFVKGYWWTIVLAVIGLTVFFRFVKRTSSGRHFIDRLKLSMPLFGPVIQKLAVARFARTLGTLLENGVSMMPSLEIVKNIANNSIIYQAIEFATECVGKGEGLGQSLDITKAFPELSVQMVHVGEQSGQLESMLNKVADVYENDVETTVMSLTSLLEPVLILVMAGIVGLIVLAICLPIFEMNQLIM